MINGGLTIGEFTAFYIYLIMLSGPMRMLGMALGMAQRAIASGNRLFEILDREPRGRIRARRAARSPTAPAQSSCATSRCAIRDGRRSRGNGAGPAEGSP